MSHYDEYRNGACVHCANGNRQIDHFTYGLRHILVQGDSWDDSVHVGCTAMHLRDWTESTIVQAISELATVREAKHKDHAASVEALKAAGLYGEHDNDNLSVLGAFHALQIRLAALREENSRWKKAVEGLTPLGSEFVNDPEACAAHIRDRYNPLHTFKKLRADLDSAITLLRKSEPYVLDGIEEPILYPRYVDWASTLHPEIEKFLKEHA